MEQISSSHDVALAEIQNFPGKYPKQIWALFFSEMWERFCFYGMRGMLTFFMVYQLGMEKGSANLQYGATQAWVYAFTFIGGLFADKILGFRKSLFWGGLLMITGSLILMFDPKAFFFLGIAFLVIGTGFFKPNISSMVGQLYRPEDTRRDAGFSLFYSGINIGAFFGGMLMIGIGKGQLFEHLIPENLRWNVAFGLVALVMTISLFTFLFTHKGLGPIGAPPIDYNKFRNKRWYQYAVYIGALASIPLIIIMVSNTRYTDYFMYFIGPFSLVYLAYEMRSLTRKENEKLVAALIFILFSVVFWAIFEQAGGSLSLYAAEHLKSDLAGLTVDPNIVNNSANSLFVILFAPLAGLFWLWLSQRKLEPNGIIKFGIGFLLLGLGFYTFFTDKFTSGTDGLASLNIFTLGYFVVTFAELALSPIGLSLMTKLATPRLQGFMMGMWFLASAYGQYVAGLFGADISPAENATPLQKLEVYSQGYHQFAIYAVIAGVMIIVISPLIKKLMHEVK
ncbi:MAG: peptide MFS transporter [Bacteroidetes bacterium]|nr:peptide MFS transporter [Bacteroidota bacterium]MBS1739218.1 peptide MFS transporter [Bacteroidota bacterium]MBS1775667.1 peptide MFS transporter [Bacteroidota bacterium]